MKDDSLKNKLDFLVGQIESDVHSFKISTSKKSKDYFLSSIGENSDRISQLIQYVLKFGEE